MNLRVPIINAVIFLLLITGNSFAQRMLVFSKEEDLTEKESIEINLRLSGGKGWFTKSRQNKLFMKEVE